MSVTQDGGALYAQNLAYLGSTTIGAGEATRALEQQQKAIAYQWRELVVTGQAVAVQALLPIAREGIGVVAMFTELLRVSTQVLTPLTSNEHVMRALTAAATLLAGRAALGLLLTQFPSIGAGLRLTHAWFLITTGSAEGLKVAVNGLAASMARLLPVALAVGALEIWRMINGIESGEEMGRQGGAETLQAIEDRITRTKDLTQVQQQQLRVYSLLQEMGTIADREAERRARMSGGRYAPRDSRLAKADAVERAMLAESLRAQGVTLADLTERGITNNETIFALGAEYARTGQLADFAGQRMAEFGLALNMINTLARGQLTEAFTAPLQPAQQLLERVKGIVEWLQKPTAVSQAEREGIAQLSALEYRAMELKAGGLKSGELAEYRSVMRTLERVQGDVDLMAKAREVQDTRKAAGLEPTRERGAALFNLPEGLVQIAVNNESDIDTLMGKVTASIKAAIKNQPVAPAGAP